MNDLPKRYGLSRNKIPHDVPVQRLRATNAAEVEMVKTQNGPRWHLSLNPLAGAFRQQLLQHQQCIELSRSWKNWQQPIEKLDGLVFVCSCKGKTKFVEVSRVEVDNDQHFKCLANMVTYFCRHGARNTKRELRKSYFRSKALLYRYLDRRQKQDIKAYNEFYIQTPIGMFGLFGMERCHYKNIPHIVHRHPPLTLRCPDGGMYEFCIHAEQHDLPLFDNVLAHKVLMESNLKDFLSMAHTTLVEGDERSSYQNGLFLIDPNAPKLKLKSNAERFWEALRI